MANKALIKKVATMKTVTISILMLILTVNSYGQTNIAGQYRTEGWDMFWLAKPRLPLGAPETFSSRGRTVDFNIDIDDVIMKASLEFDYFDGDFLLDIEQQYTSFYILIDGQIIDSVEFQNNSSFIHKSVDMTQWISESRYSLPVTFSVNPLKSKDGVIIARPYLVVNDEINIKGQYRTEGWDMFWLAKPRLPLGAPEIFSSRGRTVDFNIDIDDEIMNASLEFDYFDGDFLLDIEQEYTSFDIMIDGQIIDSVEFQNNSNFIHKSIDLTQWIKESRYSLPVTFSTNQLKAKDGVIIARPYLTVNNDVILNNNTPSEDDINQYILFPNPANNQITLSFIIKEYSRIEFLLSDMQGKLLTQTAARDYDPGFYEENFDLSQLNSGLYFLTIQQNHTKTTKKFIIK
jgi:hypothetical protein